MTTRAQLEQWSQDPNVQRMLEIISRAEGTFNGANPYAVYGGSAKKQLQTLAAHPSKAGSWEFAWNDGTRDQSTAAGKYQFVEGTWNNLAKKYGFGDFGATNQDLGAVALMAEKGAIKDVLRGDWHTAAKKLGSTWASLPTSTAAQAKRSYKDFERIIAQSTGQRTIPQSAVAPTQPTPVAAPAAVTAPKLSAVSVVVTPRETYIDPTLARLSKDELEAIMPVSFTAPKVSETFFTPELANTSRFFR